MSVSLTLSGPRVSVANAEDPYKKYWWVILIGFGVTAAWLLVPMMDTQVGSARVNVGGPATDASVEQSFDSAGASQGGSGVDLSMDGIQAEDKEKFVPSMLYQAPGGSKTDVKDGALAGHAAAAPAGLASLAAQLKAAAKKKDPTGWGGEKARQGFTSPHLSGSSLSGLGSASGGSSASASVGGGMGAFGSRRASVGSTSTRGLREDPSLNDTGMGGLKALAQAQKQASAAAREVSGDAAVSRLNRVFDGAQGRQNSIGAGGGALGGAYAAMDTQAPTNLKNNDPKLDLKKIKAPPAAPAPTPPDNSAQIQMAMSLVGMAIGGMVGGAAGGMIMMAVQQAGQMMQQEAAQKRAEQMQQQQQQQMDSLDNSLNG
jgi:hypothetical protein